jgi:hypothetical protein
MDEQNLKGRISFVNHEKYFATIDYTLNNKKKSVNFKTKDTTAAGTKKKAHLYRIGDEVSFQLKLSDRGDKMTAYSVKFLYNTALEQLINKAKVENRFSGYFKIVDEQFFVKEWDSYLFFPLQVSPWEKPPVESAANEAITFKLVNLDKTNIIAAELFSHSYIPEYQEAVRYFEKKAPVEATVYKVSPYAIHLGLFNDKIKARLSVEDNDATGINEGDKIQVAITHLTPLRIVVEKRGS